MAYYNLPKIKPPPGQLPQRVLGNRQRFSDTLQQRQGFIDQRKQDIQTGYVLKALLAEPPPMPLGGGLPPPVQSLGMPRLPGFAEGGDVDTYGGNGETEDERREREAREAAGSSAAANFMGAGYMGSMLPRVYAENVQNMVAKMPEAVQIAAGEAQANNAAGNLAQIRDYLPGGEKGPWYGPTQSPAGALQAAEKELGPGILGGSTNPLDMPANLLYGGPVAPLFGMPIPHPGQEGVPSLREKLGQEGFWTPAAEAGNKVLGEVGGAYGQAMEQISRNPIGAAGVRASAPGMDLLNKLGITNTENVARSVAGSTLPTTYGEAVPFWLGALGTKGPLEGILNLPGFDEALNRSVSGAARTLTSPEGRAGLREAFTGGERGAMTIPGRASDNFEWARGSDGVMKWQLKPEAAGGVTPEGPSLAEQVRIANQGLNPPSPVAPNNLDLGPVIPRTPGAPQSDFGDLPPRPMAPPPAAPSAPSFHPTEQAFDLEQAGPAYNRPIINDPNTPPWLQQLQRQLERSSEVMGNPRTILPQGPQMQQLPPASLEGLRQQAGRVPDVMEMGPRTQPYPVTPRADTASGYFQPAPEGTQGALRGVGAPPLAPTPPAQTAQSGFPQGLMPAMREPLPTPPGTGALAGQPELPVPPPPAGPLQANLPGAGAEATSNRISQLMEEARALTDPPERPFPFESRAAPVPPAAPVAPPRAPLPSERAAAGPAAPPTTGLANMTPAARALVNNPGVTPKNFDYPLSRILSENGIPASVTNGLTPAQAIDLLRAKAAAPAEFVPPLERPLPDPGQLRLNDPDKFAISQRWMGDTPNAPASALTPQQMSDRLYHAGLESIAGKEGEFTPPQLKALTERYNYADSRGIKLPGEEPPSGMPLTTAPNNVRNLSLDDAEEQAARLGVPFDRKAAEIGIPQVKDEQLDRLQKATDDFLEKERIVNSPEGKAAEADYVQRLHQEQQAKDPKAAPVAPPEGFPAHINTPALQRGYNAIAYAAYWSLGGDIGTIGRQMIMSTLNITNVAQSMEVLKYVGQMRTFEGAAKVFDEVDGRVLKALEERLGADQAKKVNLHRPEVPGHRAGDHGPGMESRESTQTPGLNKLPFGVGKGYEVTQTMNSGALYVLRSLEVERFANNLADRRFVIGLGNNVNSPLAKQHVIQSYANMFAVNTGRANLQYAGLRLGPLLSKAGPLFTSLRFMMSVPERVPYLLPVNKIAAGHWEVMGPQWREGVRQHAGFLASVSGVLGVAGAAGATVDWEEGSFKFEGLPKVNLSGGLSGYWNAIREAADGDWMPMAGFVRNKIGPIPEDALQLMEALPGNGAERMLGQALRATGVGDKGNVDDFLAFMRPERWDKGFTGTAQRGDPLVSWSTANRALGAIGPLWMAKTAQAYNAAKARGDDPFAAAAATAVPEFFGTNTSLSQPGMLTQLRTNAQKDPEVPAFIRETDIKDLLPKAKEKLDEVAAKQSPEEFKEAKKQADEQQDPAFKAHRATVEKIETEQAQRKTEVYEALREGKLNGQQVRELRDLANSTAQAKKQAAGEDKAFKKALDDLPEKSEASKALSAYYQIAPNFTKPNGKIDWDQARPAQLRFFEAVEATDAKVAKALAYELLTKDPLDNPLDKLFNMAQPTLNHYLGDLKNQPIQKGNELRANPRDDALLNLLGYAEKTQTTQAAQMLQNMRQSLPASGERVAAGASRGNSAPVAAAGAGGVGPAGRTVQQIAGTPYKSDAERNFYFESRGLPVPKAGAQAGPGAPTQAGGGSAFQTNAAGRTAPVNAADMAPYAQRYGISAGPLALLMNHEGNGAHDNSEPGVQPARWGIVQTTARANGINDTRTMTPQQAYDIAGKYIATGLEQFRGQEDKAYGSYFLGAANIQKAQNQGGDWVRNADQIAYGITFNGKHVYGDHAMTDFMKYLGFR